MSWGTTWGSRFGGGFAAAATTAAAASSATGALAIIRRFQAALEAAAFRNAMTGALDLRLQRADPRYPLEQAPLGGSHRRFEVRLVAGRIARQYVGSGTGFLGATAVVRVSYVRPGGDAGGGDRTSVNLQAGEDGTLIADCLTDRRNWDRDNTGIRMVTLDRAAALVVDDRLREIWETRVAVEYEVPWPLTAV